MALVEIGLAVAAANEVADIATDRRNRSADAGEIAATTVIDETAVLRGFRGRIIVSYCFGWGGLGYI